MGIFSRALRNVGRKKTRTLLVALALAFSVASIISVQTGVEASQNHTQEMIDRIVYNTQETVNSTISDYDALIENVRQGMEDVGNVTSLQLRQIQVTAFSLRGGGGGGGGKGGDGLSQNEPLTDDAINDILSLDGVEDIVPMVTKRVGEELRHPDYVVYGFPLDAELNEKYRYLPSTIIEGRQLAENDSSVVVVNADLKYFFNAGVGDTIEIEDDYGIDWEFTIVGICSSTMESFGSPVYMDISDAQKIAGLYPDEYPGLNVYAVNESVVDSLAYDIEEMYPDYHVTTYADFAATNADRIEKMQEMQLENLEEEKNVTVAKLEADMNTQISQLENDMQGIEDTGNQITLISAVTAGLIILFMMSYTVKERIKEIGTLKALGFTGSSIMSQFMTEGTIIGFIGGGVGIIMALVATPILSSLLLPESEAYASSNPTIQLIVMALGLTALLGALASLYPAWDAARKSPVEAMRHE